MRLTICGSVSLAQHMVGVYNAVKEAGHEPLMHDEIFSIADGTSFELIEGIKTTESHAELKKKYDFIRWWYQCILSGDGVVICNFDKNGIANYIGGNALMEMGFAHVNHKKVFLWNPAPTDVSYCAEIQAMTDGVLQGDARNIQ